MRDATISKSSARILFDFVYPHVPAALRTLPFGLSHVTILTLLSLSRISIDETNAAQASESEAVKIGSFAVE